MSSLEHNAQALIELVRSDAARRRHDQLEAARAQAGALLREAHHAARRRVRRAFDEERRRARDRLAAARATLETRRRLAQQRHDAALLAAAWEALPASLAQHWHDNAARATWVARTLAAARASLPAGTWRIVHPIDWPESERAALAASIAGFASEPEFCADAAVRAGIAIQAGGATVDATLEALLADRVEIGATLLQRLDEGR